MTRPEVEVLADARAVGERFAEMIADFGPRSVALSRPTPADAFAAAAGLDLSARLFQVDERAAPHGSDDRNATLIERALPLWTARFYPMPVGDTDLELCAERYEEVLRAALGEPPVLDVVHLGLGPDGHTASLLPGDPILGIDDRWVGVTREHQGYRRMTLTYATLEAARRIVFVASGEAKAQAVASVLSGDRAMPAARIDNDEVTFLLDVAAASAI